MGKRKSEEEIRRKIKRLTKKLRSREKIPDEFEDVGSHDEVVELSDAVDYDTEEEGVGDHRRLQSVIETASLGPPLCTSDCPNQSSEGPHVVCETEPIPSAENDTAPALPTEILEVLGEAKKSEETVGKNLPFEISERWGKILTEGLTKEHKEKLITSVQIPGNFQLAKAPILNAEVLRVLNDSTKNRDKRLEKMQSQLGSAIAGLANLTSTLINSDGSEISRIDLIKSISETNQILMDLHYEETMNRRRLLIPILDKSFINVIQGVKREKFLFGDNLEQNIKTTKSIERSSLQIKKNIPPPPAAARRPATGTGPQGVQGNARVPLRQVSGQGAARAPFVAQARYYQPPPLPATRRPPPAARRPPQPPQPQSRPQDRRMRR